MRTNHQKFEFQDIYFNNSNQLLVITEKTTTAELPEIEFQTPSAQFQNFLCHAISLAYSVCVGQLETSPLVDQGLDDHPLLQPDK